jgi:hypothetical protein
MTKFTNSLAIRNRILIILLIITIQSCGLLDSGEKVDEGKVEGEYYISSEIGWTIKIPSGWKLVSKNIMDKNQEKGKELISETINSEIDDSGLKHLISFKKNNGNLFQSTSEPFESEYDGQYQETVQFIYQVIYDSFQNQGIKVDAASSYARIDGLKFDLLRITMYGKDGEIILNQEMYTRLINGYLFSATLSYNNAKDKHTMMNVWSNSKFGE